MLTDFIYTTESKKVMVAVGKSQDSSRYEFIEFSQFVATPEEDEDCLLYKDRGYVSSPHSSSFLDLNGDCLPDIFMSKIRQEGSKWISFNEILVSKIINGKQKFCLVEDDMRLLPTEQTEFSSEQETIIPLVQFSDVNMDAMFDLLFYHEQKLYVFYNQITASNFRSEDLNDQQ